MNAQPTPVKVNGFSLQSQAVSDDLTTDESGMPELTFVINLIDSEGREFYLDINNNLVSLSIGQLAEPLPIMTNQLIPKLASVRRQVIGQCHIYGLPMPEFNERRLTTTQV